VLPTSFLRISKTHNRISLQVWMQMYCTFVLFVKQHFPGLPASGTHCIWISQLLHTCYAARPPHFFWFESPKSISWRVQIITHLISQFLQPPANTPLQDQYVILNTFVSGTFQPSVRNREHVPQGYLIRL
jgi:hypothetical protein